MKRVTSAALLVYGACTLPAFVSAAPLELVTTTTQSVRPSVTESTRKDLGKRSNTEAFCSKLAETRSILEAKVREREEAVITYLDTLTEELENERNGRDAKLEEARSEADQKRGEWYGRLAARADGKNEIAAVEEYQQRMEEAVDDRRDAIDMAVLKLRTGADTLITQRKRAIQSARETFTASVTTAFGRVETDCASGVATTPILSNLTARLGNARTKLTLDKQAAETLRKEMRKLADVHESSVAAAVKVFQTELAIAKVDLQQAFKED